MVKQGTCPRGRACRSRPTSERRGLRHADQLAVVARDIALRDPSGERWAARTSEEKRRRTVWCGRKTHGANTMAGPPESPAMACVLALRGGRRGQRLPELRGVDAVLLHLEVQRLVVHPEEPRRLAFVPSGGLQGQADRLPFGVRRGCPGELLQGGASWRWLCVTFGDGRRLLDGEEGEVLGLNHIRSQEAGPPNDVPELPHVPRPLVAQQDLSRRF